VITTTTTTTADNDDDDDDDNNNNNNHVPSSHNLHSTITEKLHKIAHILVIPLVLSTMGNIQNKLHTSLKQLNLCPALSILIHKAVIFNTCHIVRKILAEQ